jgi:phosphatidylglycerol:prolipoprotein diacylglycerol transferase
MLNLRELIDFSFISINLYGILFAAAGIAISILLKKFMINHKKDPELAITATIYLLLGVLIGARLFYVLFYNLSYFINTPIEIFYLWQGGMSFHGGLLGMFLSGYLFCRRNNLSALEIADTLAIPAAIILFLGKFVNFFNNELYGTITSLPWCIKFEGILECRHPVQVYEALKNLILFLLLIVLKKRNPKKGVIFFSFVSFYTLGRFFIDFFREYSKEYLGLGVGQYLNIVSFFIAAYFLWKTMNNTEN